MSQIKFVVYALNWNESRVIPAFLHHYRQADRIIVYDNGSSDNSIDLIKSAGREVRHFDTDGKLDDCTNMEMKNKIWKESINDNVDYIIVQDLDEFIYFPDYPDDIIGGLTHCKNNNYTGGGVIGYNMVCSDEEWDFALQQIKDYSIGVCWTIRNGYYDASYNKPNLFDPKEITETNYSPGSHTWSPVGKIVLPNIKIYLLHYKYIGVNYSLKNHIDKRERLSSRNITLSYGYQYNNTDEYLKDYVQKLHLRDTQEIAKKPRVKMVIGLHDTMEFLDEAIKDKSLHVYAFEPNKTTVDLVKKMHNIPDNYHIIDKAVSNKNCTATFNICSNPTCSSLQDWGNGPKFGSMTQVEVECIKMEDFITNNHIENIEYLQIDTQGHDLCVLEGFGDKIKLVKHGLCESLAPDVKWQLYKDQPSFQDFKNFFDKNGFSIKWSFNINSGCPKDEVNIEFE